MYHPFQSFLIIVTLLSIALGCFYLVRALIVSFNRRKQRLSKERLSQLLEGNCSEREKQWCSKHWILLMDQYILLRQSVSLSEKQHSRLTRFWEENRCVFCFIKKLSSNSAYQRCRAARYLGYIDSDISRNGLIHSLMRENKEPVKVYILHSLSLQNFSGAIPNIVDSIQGGSTSYLHQVSGVLQNFKSAFIAFFPVLSEHTEEAVQEVIIDFARNITHIQFGPYLKKLFISQKTSLRIKKLAFQALIHRYPREIDPVEYLHDSDPSIRESAIMGLATRASRESVDQLIELLEDPDYADTVVKSLSNSLKYSRPLFQYINDCLVNESRQTVVEGLINVVSNRIDYFLPLMNSTKGKQNKRIIREVLKSGRVSNIISFLNKNNDSDLENRILKIIQRSMEKDKLDTLQFQYYLKESLLFKLGLSSRPVPESRINDKNEGVKRGPLFLIFFLVMASLPLLYLYHRYLGAPGGDLVFLLKQSLNTFLLIFGYYCLLLNFFYYLLFVLSFMNSRKQKKFWDIKDYSFLFSSRMLPSLSILVPAYGEEETIIDNVLSLLNLHYPEFEVIVVNDGSKDQTLQVLIDYFQLEKEDMVYEHHLKTQPVRGLYANKNIPELIVIDKINGGKADSLNVGINLASKDYFVGVDSDSLLDRDALLILTSSFLDEDKPVVAAGGNIMPVNGCQVDQGVLENISIPSNPVALMQNIEYVRSFLSGRMGWAYMNTLLIISGAFGVFRREEVLRIKGYLTSREVYLKDTVGEDMELVVRLSRNLKENKEPFSALYLFLANCWTEVPQSLKILKRQRDRWQRGLIDILSFHKKMIFNPRFGSIGMLGFPYYLFVEVIGPWYEFLANLFFVFGIISGWVSLPVLMLVVGSNFVLSFSLSISSLIIMDWDGSRYSLKDRIFLLLSSLIETLGFRQIVSFFRITGFWGALRNKTGWGTITRKGFHKKGEVA